MSGKGLAVRVALFGLAAFEAWCCIDVIKEIKLQRLAAATVRRNQELYKLQQRFANIHGNVDLEIKDLLNEL